LIGILITACGLAVIGAGLSAHIRADDASPTLDY
jgi:hypothetical protein